MTSNEREALRDLVDAAAWAAGGPYTQEQIAERLGLSQRTVAKIEKRAIEKLRGLTRSSWGGTLREPGALVRRLGEVFATDGAAACPWSDKERSR